MCLTRITSAFYTLWSNRVVFTSNGTRRGRNLRCRGEPTNEPKWWLWLCAPSKCLTWMIWPWVRSTSLRRQCWTFWTTRIQLCERRPCGPVAASFSPNRTICESAGPWNASSTNCCTSSLWQPPPTMKTPFVWPCSSTSTPSLTRSFPNMKTCSCSSTACKIKTLRLGSALSKFWDV